MKEINSALVTSGMVHEMCTTASKDALKDVEQLRQRLKSLEAKVDNKELLEALDLIHALIVNLGIVSAGNLAAIDYLVEEKNNERK